MRAWLLVVHFPGMVLWVGGLLVTTLLLASHTREAGAEAREALARVEQKLFRGIVHPGAALSVLTGLLLILTDPALYLRAPWLHAKLFLALILVVLDLRIYVRAKAFYAGNLQVSRNEWIASHAAVAVIFLGILVMVLVRPL
ncbi:MAG: CopD family protein [Acidobacteria bacterium]|nr:CopD family protein [Acidobacteriota bacterium]